MLETPEGNLSQAVHCLNVGYSIWLNRKYRRVGPLFQGRFKAILHEPAEALVINRYIHLNPVRIEPLGGHEGRSASGAEITEQLARRRVDALEQFPWSRSEKPGRFCILFHSFCTFLGVGRPLMFSSLCSLRPR